MRRQEGYRAAPCDNVTTVMKAQTRTTIGIDLGDRKHSICVLDCRGHVLKEKGITNSRGDVPSAAWPAAIASRSDRYNFSPLSKPRPRSGLLELLELDVVPEMNTNPKSPEVWLLTSVSLVILLVFYPMTIAATGPLSNGGLLGFTSLLVAGVCSWTAFVRCRANPILRWIVLLPIAALVTWFAAWDGLAQHHSGWWR